MAQVAVLIRITPEDPEKVEELVQNIKSEFKPINIGTENLAFGIKAVKVLFYVNEAEGSSILEEKLSKVQNVSNVDVLSVDRLS
jgi:translation elongation factor aEF-1 beta